MSILIKGAKMPTKCDECFYLNECKAFDKLSTAEQGFLVFALKRRAKDCPFVEIPPHGRLIDADEINYYSPSFLGLESPESPTDERRLTDIDEIDDMPTVIESEEPEHE